MRVLTIDISNNFDEALASIFDLFAYVFNQMNSITFHGTSILMLFLGITILGVAIPIVLTIGTNITDPGERIKRDLSDREYIERIERKRTIKNFIDEGRKIQK